MLTPLRILDSKRPADREVCVDAPDIIDSLSDDARAYFTAVQDGLTKLGGSRIATLAWFEASITTPEPSSNSQPLSLAHRMLSWAVVVTTVS